VKRQSVLDSAAAAKTVEVRIPSVKNESHGTPSHPFVPKVLGHLRDMESLPAFRDTAKDHRHRYDCRMNAVDCIAAMTICGYARRFPTDCCVISEHDSALR